MVGAAPFTVSAFVNNLGASVRRGMVGVNREATFKRQPVAIAPSELAIGPIQIGAVPVGGQYPIL